MINLHTKILRSKHILHISVVFLLLASGLTHAMSDLPPMKLGNVDTDGDGFNDGEDAFPLDPTQSKSPRYCGDRLVKRIIYGAGGWTYEYIPIIDPRCGRSSIESVESKNTLLGTDIDGNGVRDDVQGQIEHKFNNNAEVKAKTLEMAMSYQMILSGSLNNKQINQHIAEVQRLDSCIRDKTTDTDVGNAFLAHRQFSTVARTRAYLTAARDAHYAEGPPDFKDCEESSSNKTQRKSSSKINAPDLTDYDIYFINGVRTNEKDSNEIKEELQTLIKKNPVKLLWNENHFILELFDLYIEKLGEVRIDKTDTQGFWKYVISGEVSPGVAAAIWWSIGRWMDPDRDVGYWSEKDLERMIKRIKESLDNNRKTLVVSHSQGNFFYRNIHQAIDQWDTDKTKQCFAGIGFAPPLSSKSGNFDYITNTNDKVINAVRGVWNNTLSANVTVPEGYNDDEDGHGLLQTYLDHSAPLSRFETELKQAVKQIDESCKNSEHFAESGDQGNHTFKHTRTDTTPQDLQIEFDALSIEDGINVTANGYTLASSNGLVSGIHVWDVKYDPKKHGKEFTIIVDAPYDNTGWNVCIDYVGSNCGNEIERKQVSYSIDGASPANFPEYVCINHSINGQSVPKSGTVQLSKGQHMFTADCWCNEEIYNLCSAFHNGGPRLYLWGASCGSQEECSLYTKKYVRFEVY